LLKKSGSASPRRVFRAMLREIIAADAMPDYHLSEEPGDILRVTLRDAVIDVVGEPLVSTDALEQARLLVPGSDVYALEAEWRAWWVRTGRPHLRSPDRAFLGWVRGRSAQ
ncbi:MAG: replication initiator protein A, partial [Pseudomonadota bacterium]